MFKLCYIARPLRAFSLPLLLRIDTIATLQNRTSSFVIKPKYVSDHERTKDNDQIASLLLLAEKGKFDELLESLNDTSSTRVFAKIFQTGEFS
jgi:hypothetical protein